MTMWKSWTHQIQTRAARQLRDPPGCAERQLRQRTLRRRHEIERQHADVAQRLDRPERLREQPHQPVGEADDVAAIGDPPLAIALAATVPSPGSNAVALLRTPVGEHFRQAGCIAQAEIETLPGDRMQRLRGVADDRQPLGHVLVRARQRQRIQLPRCRRAVKRPSRKPKASCRRARNSASFSLRHSSARLRQSNVQIKPDPPFGHRQQRQRPGRSEALVRDVIVKALREHVGHQRGLLVVPASARRCPRLRATRTARRRRRSPASLRPTRCPADRGRIRSADVLVCRLHRRAPWPARAR